MTHGIERQIVRTDPFRRSLIAAAIVLAACGAPGASPSASAPPSASATPTPSPAPRVVSTRLLALLTGQLVMVNQCLRVESSYGPESLLLVWPVDITATVSGATVQVTDLLEKKQATWHLGEVVVVGGGNIPNVGEGLRRIGPADCPGPYYVVSGVYPSATPTPGTAPTSAGTLAATPTPSFSPTLTPTPVPVGVFALTRFYTPLVMNYDTSLWKDESRYLDLSVWTNSLQARGLDHCTLGPEGPNGDYPAPDYLAHLGKVRYQVAIFKNLKPGSVLGSYIDTNSLPNYDYQSKGIVHLNVQANASEWPKCQQLAEAVLSTLHVPE